MTASTKNQSSDGKTEKSVFITFTHIFIPMSMYMKCGAPVAQSTEAHAYEKRDGTVKIVATCVICAK